ncbi:MAG: dimethyl sulfoxide reductase anchor subunit [Burkholderiaceae bacterium]|nr:dimethyl sulfoxide reductase anchor subunit [Sulfuritalea sp.]MCF8174064.1 dimethyl sulfoxide reductase anchor subunit [Burkholderiaceae bacterium]MCF8183690.1 dimethyl sulfoxide reductase anchor subunit [Polynucleobacter sp.]
MKKLTKKSADLLSPRQQRNWDWRAAANFIAGGAGGSLLLWTAFAGFPIEIMRASVLLGLMLIGTGLTCVWFEIGRPWRALNVYKHVATSWMTREAMVAALLFPLGGLALLTAAPGLVIVTGVLGAVFLYTQARILAANKGIPTWRHPRSIQLMVATGLAEGAGFLICVVALSSSLIGTWGLVGVFALIAARAYFWKAYLGGLHADGAPEGALIVLNRFDSRFVIFGHILPGLAIVAALAGMPGQTAVLFAAGILMVASGWTMKFNLVLRAAFTQGLALLHLPVRGSGVAGAAAKPGWTMTGAKAG